MWPEVEPDVEPKVEPKVELDAEAMMHKELAKALENFAEAPLGARK